MGSLLRHPFANPAVTMARSLTDTFAGIRPADVPLFILAQLPEHVRPYSCFERLAPGVPAEKVVSGQEPRAGEINNEPVSILEEI